MKTLQRILKFTLITSIFSIQAFAQKTDEKSAALLKAMTEVNGGYEKLAAQNDVQYTYVYDNFDKGKDVSVEKYIFNGEHSWGAYETHQIHVLPKQEGKVVQSLVNNKVAVTLNGEAVTDPKAVGTADFLRKVNIFWFAMMYKLNDPGTVYEYQGNEEVDGVTYDKVRLTYKSAVTKKEKNDEYILYFNPSTHLVDFFYFNIVGMGITKPVIKMSLEYEQINGVYVATTRKSFAPNEKGEYTLNGEYTSSDVKFNNGFKPEDFKL
ncbi:DUF6503 family protein [Aquimarina agarivorans]|uniref:DUF6503 family protein n=1 Tax=Aquimarina agarivorans TaxID=980584 RepID=UPI000248E95A|nr:DUF6503 family protein [Aquimarina agarivorans]